MCGMLGKYLPRSLTASSNFFSSMAFWTSWVWWQRGKKVVTLAERISGLWWTHTHLAAALPAAWAPTPTHTLTIWTHSMSGSRTAWLPTRDTTQAGVLADASSNASTASTPIRLACRGQMFENQKRRNWCKKEQNKTIQLCSWCRRVRSATHQDPVKGWGRPTSLHVAQDGDPGVKTQTAYHQLDTKKQRSKVIVKVQN